MFEQNIIEHHIQKSIMQVLMHNEYARYSEMRPERVDSNLYAYHLNRLVLSGYVEKVDKLYRLSLNGLRYVEHTSSSIKINSQPKITTAIIVKDVNGNILLTKRLKQPYINYYGLPLGKIHSDKDSSILDSAIRELYEKTGVKHEKMEHVGDVYLRIHIKGVLISDLLAHVFSTVIEKEVSISDSAEWVAKKDLKNTKLIPGVMEIIKLADSGERFFEEISV
ncbi:MAG: NUDIX domain-containing protein [Candidatus Saccharibacteria bacterium]